MTPITRRTTLRVVWGIPFLQLFAPFFSPQRPRSARVCWDWAAADLAGPVERFEVSVSPEGPTPGAASLYAVTVEGGERWCEIPLPTSGSGRLRVEVRAVNRAGVSPPCSLLLEYASKSG